MPRFQREALFDIDDLIERGTNQDRQRRAYELFFAAKEERKLGNREMADQLRRTGNELVRLNAEANGSVGPRSVDAALRIAQQYAINRVQKIRRNQKKTAMTLAQLAEAVAEAQRSVFGNKIPDIESMPSKLDAIKRLSGLLV